MNISLVYLRGTSKPRPDRNKNGAALQTKRQTFL